MSERLPAVYASFTPIFSRMSPALSSVLCGILEAFAAQSFTRTPTDRHPSGDFVGYDGLQNRGSLSNLLETEWLLRDIDPDDFARRIAEHEVLYRRKDFADPGKRNTLAVVLDCGPWMLGRNRLIALASLFYLADRASRTGGRAALDRSRRTRFSVLADRADRRVGSRLSWPCCAGTTHALPT